MSKRSAIFLFAAFVGCSRPSDGFSGVDIATTIGPIDDNFDLFDANVVVNLAAQSVDTTVECSGILVTRTRLLTASHCVVGLPTLSVGSSPPVQVGSVSFGTTGGNALASASQPASPISELGHYTDSNNPNDVGADIAIVALDEGALNAQLGRLGIYSVALDSTDWGTLLGTNIVRPSLAPSFVDAIGFAAWGGSTERQTFVYSAAVSLDGNSFAMNRSGAVPGDSGAPVFTIRTDRSRDPFGILSGGDDMEDATFVNLTSPRNSAWIVSQLTDHSHDAKPKWQSMHPPLVGSSWWIGEDEYSGPCTPALDIDCDHWLDANDNCPTIFNHDQADADDDGIGDACP